MTRHTRRTLIGSSGALFMIGGLAGLSNFSRLLGDEDKRIRRFVPSGPIGVCTVEQWMLDWPGCVYEDGVKEKHLSIVATERGRAFRVDYAVGEIGPEKGGVGWRCPIPMNDGVELVYRVAFSDDFDWGKGGKLPGLCGGPESVTGGNPANGKNGFSVRLMWRAEGRGEAYVYHMHQPGKYGESFPFSTDFQFPKSTDVRVRLRVSMNTPGERDGRLDVWIASAGAQGDRHVISRSDLEWRSIPSVAVDGLLFETFHGGSDRSWAPQRQCSTLFQDIEVEFLGLDRQPITKP